MYKRILLATDGSPTSQQALLETVKLAREGATIKVVTVIINPMASIPSPYGVDYVGMLRDAAVESGRAALEKSVQQLKEKGVNAEGCLIDLSETVGTRIASALLAEANEWPADLVVIGTHGYSGVKRFFLGSVAEELIRSSNIPVLLVHGKES